MRKVAIGIPGGLRVARSLLSEVPKSSAGVAERCGRYPRRPGVGAIDIIGCAASRDGVSKRRDLHYQMFLKLGRRFGKARSLSQMVREMRGRYPGSFEKLRRRCEQARSQFHPVWRWRDRYYQTLRNAHALSQTVSTGFRTDATELRRKKTQIP